MARNRNTDTLIWSQQDKSYRVLVESRRDREGYFRVRHWFIGGARKTLSVDSREEAEAIAQRLWENHLINPNIRSVNGCPVYNI